MQSRSFNDFVQLDILPENRKNVGLEKVFRDIFPINYDDALLSLEYAGYELGHWGCACGVLSGIQERYSWECEHCKTSGISELVDNVCSECKEKLHFIKNVSQCLVRVKIKPNLSVLQSVVQKVRHFLCLLR